MTEWLLSMLDKIQYCTKNTLKYKTKVILHEHWRLKVVIVTSLHSLIDFSFGNGHIFVFVLIKSFHLLQLHHNFCNDVQPPFSWCPCCLPFFIVCSSAFPYYCPSFSLHFWAFITVGSPDTTADSWHVSCKVPWFYGWLLLILRVKYLVLYVEYRVDVSIICLTELIWSNAYVIISCMICNALQ